MSKEKTMQYPDTHGGTVRRALVLVAVVFGVVLSMPAVASASAPAPAWSIVTQRTPTVMAPGSTYGSARDSYNVTVTNSGGGNAGTTATITVQLPPGLTVDSRGVDFSGLATGVQEPSNACSVDTSGTVVTCTMSGTTPFAAATLPIAPGQGGGLVIPVDVAATAPATGQGAVIVTGGGAPATLATFGSTVGVGTAPVGFGAFTTQLTNADGSADTQAGSHPYALSLSMQFNNTFRSLGPGNGDNPPIGDPKDMTVNLPAGMVVNPQAVPECTESELESGACPDDTDVGYVMAEIGAFDNGVTGDEAPLYNMVPPPGVPAEFGFDADLLGIFVHLMGGLRTGGDYGLTANASDILQKADLDGLMVTLWGNPSDASHDSVRGICLSDSTRADAGDSCPVTRTGTPLLTMPSQCQGPLQTTASMTTWQNPGAPINDSAESTDLSGNPVGVTGCSQLPFSPTITVQPTTTTADSPSGLQVDLSVPQPQDPNGLAEANLKDATVTLPAGTSVNPSAAAGLTGCTPAEIAINTASEPTCPNSSKIGTVQVTTPLLADPLTGGIYIAQQNNNPFGSLLAIYLIAEADGALIKLAGHVVADPVTGQLTTTFENNPQLPFSDFKLDFFGGPGAALATPAGCGTYTTSSSLTPWSGTSPVVSSDPFKISSGCVSGFSPSFTAGTTSPQAGAYSPFVLSMSRSDTDQSFSGLSVKLPPGMLAKLAGVQECSEQQLASISSATGTGAAQAANPSCPAGSQVGTVTTGAGVGPNPFFLRGKAYLTGPYKGAPYGIAIVVPAVAGPFDLGTVVVRQALDINPTTAQVTDVSDPFPTILDGIPLDIRQIDVDLNRPGFTVNPTSCDPMSVNSTLTSTGGLTYTGDSHFQVGGCAAMAFSPKLKLALTGKGQTRSADHPELTATLTDPAGQANIHSAKVALPLSLALDPNNSQHVCNNAVAAAVHGGAVGCPASTIVGTATADTPLLSKPLTGKVYLVQGIRTNKKGQKVHTLPTLLVPLRGQIALDLRAQTSVSGGKLVTTFPTIPDAAVSKFTLKINGGKKGLLVVTGRGLNICQKAQVGNADFGAQSGKTTSGNMTLSTPCGKQAKLKVLSKTTGARVTPASATAAAKTVTVGG